jgi:hypothetical protein
MLRDMKGAYRLFLALTLASSPVLAAGPAIEQGGPLGPCVEGGGAASTAPANQPGPAWGVEIATSFNKQEALDDFARVQQQYSELLGSYQVMIIEDCNLHMGTTPQYSARIGMDSREDADALCTKIKAVGGACIVQKN